MAERVRTQVRQPQQPPPQQAVAAPGVVTPLINRYRPRKFELLAGQEDVVAGIQGVMADQSAQSYLLVGPRGTGKTTSARIIARTLGCISSDLTEIDAAKYTGIDEMRDVCSRLMFRPMAGPVKVCIVDEAHRLSSNAWDSVLKITEEPPPHLHWVFCTSVMGKIPETLVSRCAKFTFVLMNDRALRLVITRICDREGIQLADGVLEVIVDEAGGSARQAISNLAVAKNATDRKMAGRILQSAAESDAVIELCRALAAGGKSWATIMGIVKKLEAEGVPAESCRMVICAYMSKAARGSTSDKDIGWFLMILQAFAYPYGQGDGMAQLLISIATALGIGSAE